MDIFNKLGKKASETYKYTAEKTGKIAKETKLKFLISENRSKIDDLYKDIGKKVYEKHIREEDIDMKEELYNFCSNIDEHAQIIEDANNEILNLKDRKQCHKCAYEIEKDFHYCPNCGKEQEEEESKKNNTVEIINKDIAKDTISKAEEVIQDVKEDIKETYEEIKEDISEFIDNEEDEDV